MGLEMLLAQFDGLIQTPADVEKLNTTILQWAVQGRLGTQCTQEENVIELVKSLNLQVEKHLSEKKLRAKWLNPIDKTNLKFNIPENWDWVCIGDCCIVERGITFPARAKESEPTEENIACLRTTNVQAKVNWNDLIYVSRDYLKSDDKIIRLNDILISMANSYELVGKVSFVDKVPIEATLGGFISTIRANKGIDPQFFYYLLGSDYIQSAFRETSSQTTNIANISLTKIYPIPIPLPPLAEQKRIVARVDELLGQTAVLAQQLATVKEQRRGMNTAVLHQLTQTTESDKSAAIFPLIHRNFDRLYVDVEMIKDLKQAILQLAVQGHLVPQDPNDEPASVLLERIATEKLNLIRKKKIRKSKPLPELDQEELPFAIPKGWEWVQLGQIALVVKDGPHYSPKYSENGIPFISTRNITPEGIDFSNTKYISEELHRELSIRIKPEIGDILYTKGGTTGIARVNTYDIEFNVWVHVAVLKLGNGLFSFYIQNALNSPHCYLQSQELTHGLGNQDLGLTRMVKITIPLPPYEEQKRIVAKVDELFALCDQLAGQLLATENGRETLLDAVLAQAV